MIVRIARVKVGNRQAPSARQSAHLSAHSDLRNVHENPRPAIAQPGVFALGEPIAIAGAGHRKRLTYCMDIQ